MNDETVHQLCKQAVAQVIVDVLFIFLFFLLFGKISASDCRILSWPTLKEIIETRVQ